MFFQNSLSFHTFLVHRVVFNFLVNEVLSWRKNWEEKHEGPEHLRLKMIKKCLEIYSSGYQSGINICHTKVAEISKATTVTD